MHTIIHIEAIIHVYDRQTSYQTNKYMCFVCQPWGPEWAKLQSEFSNILVILNDTKDKDGLNEV